MDTYCDTGQRLIGRYAAAMWCEPNVIVRLHHGWVMDHFRDCQVCDMAAFELRNGRLKS